MCFERVKGRESRDKSQTIGERVQGSGFRRQRTGVRGQERRDGFTLVELMVVIVIIGLLAGVVSVSVRSYLIRSKQNVAKMEIAKICQALDTFYGEFDRYPTTEEGLEVLVQESNAFPDGLLSRLPRDPWNNAYEYMQPGRNAPYEVISYGADNREGGSGADADISSTDLGRSQE